MESLNHRVGGTPTEKSLPATSSNSACIADSSQQHIVAAPDNKAFNRADNSDLSISMRAPGPSQQETVMPPKPLSNVTPVFATAEDLPISYVDVITEQGGVCFCDSQQGSSNNTSSGELDLANYLMSLGEIVEIIDTSRSMLNKTSLIDTDNGTQLTSKRSECKQALIDKYRTIFSVRPDIPVYFIPLHTPDGRMNTASPLYRERITAVTDITRFFDCQPSLGETTLQGVLEGMVRELNARAPISRQISLFIDGTTPVSQPFHDDSEEQLQADVVALTRYGSVSLRPLGCHKKAPGWMHQIMSHSNIASGQMTLTLSYEQEWLMQARTALQQHSIDPEEQAAAIARLRQAEQQLEAAIHPQNATTNPSSGKVTALEFASHHSTQNATELPQQRASDTVLANKCCQMMRYFNDLKQRIETDLDPKSSAFTHSAWFQSGSSYSCHFDQPPIPALLAPR